MPAYFITAVLNKSRPVHLIGLRNALRDFPNIVMLPCALSSNHRRSCALDRALFEGTTPTVRSRTIAVSSLIGGGKGMELLTQSGILYGVTLTDYNSSSKSLCNRRAICVSVTESVWNFNSDSEQSHANIAFKEPSCTADSIRAA
jgi:hypothetical protein